MLGEIAPLILDKRAASKGVKLAADADMPS
jgi:hypothetical protein